MSDCQSVQTGTITGFGSHKKMRKALALAYEDAMAKGKAACIGGSCGNPGSTCGYKFETATVIFPETREADGSWTVVIESDGRCRCE